MKKQILISSALLATLATIVSLVNSLFVTDPEFVVRLLEVSLALGLLSIALFFVGLAFPKERSRW